MGTPPNQHTITPALPPREDAGSRHSLGVTGGASTSATEQTISLGIHSALSYVPRDAEKADRDAKKTAMCMHAAYGVRNVTMTLTQFAAHVNAERGFMSAMSDGHRLTENATSQFLILDDDIGDPAFKDKVRALGCAAVIYGTATIGRQRAVIPTRQRTSDAEAYRLNMRRAQHRVGVDVDRASDVIAQVWLGGRAGTVEVIDGEFLDLDEVSTWELPPDTKTNEEWEALRSSYEYKPIEKGSAAAEKTAARVLDKLYREITAIGEGNNRKGKIAGQVRWAVAFIPNYPVTLKEIERVAFAGAAANGALAKYKEKGIQEAINWGVKQGLNDPAEPLQQAVKPARKPKKSVRRRLEKQAIINSHVAVEYISDDLKPEDIAATPTLLIQAPTGLGKTTTVAAYINTLPTDQTITAVAQYRLLTGGMHGVMPSFTHYEQADGAHQRALGKVPHLVTSVSSLPKFDRHGGVFLADEIEGVLKFTVESGTLRGGESLASFRALKAGIESAVRFIGMDANLSDITIRFMEKYRGKVEVKRYRRADPRGKVTFLSSRDAAVYTIGKLLAHRRGLVFAACSSAETATDIADHYTGSGYRVLKITKDTSNTATVKQAVRSAKLRAKYDLIVYDSACGAGVDFCEQAYAHVAVFNRKPLAPEDAIQLFGRVRHAQRRYATVPTEGENEHSPTQTEDELLADVIKRESWTARLLNATPDVAGDMLEMAQVWSAFQARRLRESARWRSHFARRLQEDGFTVVENNAHAPKAFSEAWRAWKQARADQDFTDVLGMDERGLPDEELDRLRMAGNEITREYNLRNKRWKIEEAKADPDVNNRDRDLMKHDGRRGLFHLRDWFSSMENLQAADQQQRDDSLPIHRRRNSALGHRVLSALFTLAGHDGTPEEQLAGFISTFQQDISRTDVSTRYAMLTTPIAMSKFKALGHYGNNALTPTGLCRWLLEYLGLNLVSTRRRIDGKLTMFYRVDADELAYRLQRARHAAQQRRVIRNVYSPSIYISDQAKRPDPHTTQPAGWAGDPEAFAARMALIGAPTPKRGVLMGAHP